MGSIDLGVKIKVRCANCAKLLKAWIYSRYDKTIEICAESCENCKRKEKENGEKEHN